MLSTLKLSMRCVKSMVRCTRICSRATDKPRALRDDVFDFGGGPGHQLCVFQSRGLLTTMRQIQECGFAEELVGLVYVDHHLVAVVSQAGNFDAVPR